MKARKRSYIAKALKEKHPGMDIWLNEPMYRHTTFRVGGPVPLMVKPQSEGELLWALETCRQYEVRPVVIGNGSNLLVSDEGYDGIVLKLKGDFLGEPVQAGDDRVLHVGASTTLPMLVWYAQKLGLTGLEFAQGIPGTVGGGLTMNAGAYGGELSQSLLWVEAVDLAGNRYKFPREKCALGYRSSIFQGGDYVILRAAFRLEKGDPEQIQATMDDFAARRKAKQPLEMYSAGSTFKRPEGHFAAALIEQCGLKGLRVGDAQVSEKHSGFIVNRGMATAGEIMELIKQVQEKVLAETGVKLELEVKTLGF